MKDRKEMEMTSVNRPLRIDACNCFTTRKASRKITRFYDAILEPSGLRITQFLTLAALNEVGNAGVNALAERLDIERTAMGKMLGFLERDGLVSIRPSPTDGRSRLVELTEEGRRRHNEASPLWREAQRQFEQLNGAENVTNLRSGLNAMVVGDVTKSSSDDETG
jgi:DNA-binding MarR family transcriptional regulator